MSLEISCKDDCNLCKKKENPPCPECGGGWVTVFAGRRVCPFCSYCYGWVKK